MFRTSYIHRHVFKLNSLLDVKSENKKYYCLDIFLTVLQFHNMSFLPYSGPLTLVSLPIAIGSTSSKKEFCISCF